MTLHPLDAFKGFTISASEVTENETRFLIMSIKNIEFSELKVIDELFHPKEIGVFTEPTSNKEHGEYHLEVIVENKEKIESAHQPSESDSILCKRLTT